MFESFDTSHRDATVTSLINNKFAQYAFFLKILVKIKRLPIFAAVAQMF